MAATGEPARGEYNLEMNVKFPHVVVVGDDALGTNFAGIIGRYGVAAALGS